MPATTSRQRVQMALRHQEPDRVPIDFGARHSIHIDAHRALKKHLGFQGGEETVRSYLNNSAEPDPRLLAYFGADVISFQFKPGQGYVFRIDPATDSWSDEWGIKCRRPPGGSYYDPYEYPLAAAESVPDVERFRFPDPADPHRLAGVTEAIRAAHSANDKAIMLNAPAMGIWMLGFYLRGLEQGLMDLAALPDLAEALAERITEWFMTFWDTALPHMGEWLDIVQMEGDLAMSEERGKPHGMSRRSVLKLTAGLAAATAGGSLVSTLVSSSTTSAAAPAVFKGKKLTIWFGQSFLESLDKNSPDHVLCWPADACVRRGGAQLHHLGCPAVRHRPGGVRGRCGQRGGQEDPGHLQEARCHLSCRPPRKGKPGLAGRTQCG